MNKFRFKVSPKAISFLVWFRRQYKYCSYHGYGEMGMMYGIGYSTCKKLVKELEEAGYIIIWNDETPGTRFYLNLEKYNDLVRPHVFVKENKSDKKSSHE